MPKPLYPPQLKANYLCTVLIYNVIINIYGDKYFHIFFHFLIPTSKLALERKIEQSIHHSYPIQSGPHLGLVMDDTIFPV